MAQIFISYSRADAQFISDLVPLLHEAYGVASVFYDEQIPGGTKWWEMILNEIAACDLFIYLCSNDSLHSPYCQSELREAVRLQKQILPVIVRPKTNYPYAGTDYGTAIPDDIAVILRDTNCIDLSRGFRDRELGPKAAARLYGAINKSLDAASSGSPPPLTPYPTAQPQVTDKKKRSWLNEPRAIIIAALITGMFAVVAIVIPLIINGQNGSQTQETPTLTISPSPTTQEIAAATTMPTETPNPTPTPPPSDTSVPTSTPTLTLTPSPTPSITSDFAATTQHLEIVGTQTMDAFRREQGTAQSANLTRVALSWTPTFTVTPTASPTPSQTMRPTASPTATLRPTQAPPNTPSQTSTLVQTVASRSSPVPSPNSGFLPHSEEQRPWRVGQCLVSTRRTYLRSGPGVNYAHSINVVPGWGQSISVIGDGIPVLGDICIDASICNLDDQGWWWPVRALFSDSTYPWDGWIWQGNLDSC